MSLTPDQILSIMKGFLTEAFDFMRTPHSKRPEIALSDSEPILFGVYIDYRQNTVRILHRYYSTPSLRNKPSVLRFDAYNFAFLWEEYLKTKKEAFQPDMNAMAFSIGLTMLKGIDGIPMELTTAISKDGFSLNSKIIDAVKPFYYDIISVNRTDIAGQKHNRLQLTRKSFRNYTNKLIEAVNKELSTPLPTIKPGDKGSEDNPFDNIDQAAGYILLLEKNRLATSPYRKLIQDEPVYYDIRRNIFNISWASPNVAYYEHDAADGFVVNQMSNGLFSLKPLLRHSKFLFRGQSEFYPVCVPSIYRNGKTVELVEHIQAYQLAAMISTHPLVELLGTGIEIYHDWFRFRMNYLGLTQHYYGLTPFMDLTSSLDVAKFFAVTKFNLEDDHYEMADSKGLGVLYIYEIEPDSFSTEKHGTSLSTIGKQVFMRSGNQKGFLLRMNKGVNFNDLPNVRPIFFRHDEKITRRIFDQFRRGDLLHPQEALRGIWHEQMTNKEKRNSISRKAIELYLKDGNPGNKDALISELTSYGITITDRTPEFPPELIDEYYKTALDNWEDFVSDIHFHGPEGIVLKQSLRDIPSNPRYRRAFYH